MAEHSSASPPAVGTAGIGTDDCPHVADLINYALGRCLLEERRKVEAHLEKRACSACQRWVDKTTNLSEEGPPDLTGREFAPELKGIATPPPPTPDPTPIPSSSQWQRRVFRDLEERLCRLEEI